MKQSTKYISYLVALGLALPICAAPAAGASIATQVLKGAAIGFGVTKVAKPLNQFINGITLRNGMQTKMATKVVPILSVGEKGYIGGAQVCGPASSVAKVDAVFQYEKNFSNNNYRAKVLVPSASLNPLKLERVPKVGVTAIIDVSLDGDQRYKTVGTGIRIGDAIRGAGVLVAVKNMGDGINKALNTLTFNSGSGYTTKVVPMASVGEKMYLGGAQVTASTRSINSVKALWQYEDLFSSGNYRVKIMLPTNSTNPLKMRRVDGAGLTAIVDMALSQQKDMPREESRTEGLLGQILKTRTNQNAHPGRHDNGLHKGWYKGKNLLRKGEIADKFKKHGERD